MQSLTLRSVLAEMAALHGARVEETASFDPFELRLRLGNDVWVVVSIHPRHNTLHLGAGGERPGTSRPSPFAQAAWATLGKSRFVEAAQAGLDRVAALTFERRDRLGDARRYHLVAELIGTGAHLFLLEGKDAWSGRILDRLRPAGTGDEERPLHPGGAYRLPQSGKVDASRAGEAELVQALEKALVARGRDPRALVDAWLGVSPLVARELWRRVGETAEAASFAEVWLDFLESTKGEPVLIRDARGHHEVIPFRPESAGDAESYPTFSAALVEAHRRAGEEEPHHAPTPLVRAVRQAIARVERAFAALEAERQEGAKAAEHRRMAEALLAAAEPIPRGASEALVLDPATGARFPIPLNPKLNVHANAELYFKKARKAERIASAHASRRRALSERRRALDVLAEALETRAGPPTPAWLEEAERLGVQIPREDVSPEKKKGALEDRLPSPLRPRRVELGDGWEALIGKSNRGNDVLTHEIARPDDVWMHADQAAGSHVVLRHHEKGKEPPRAVLFAAAALAAYFSKARGSSKVSILVSRKRHVRRPRKAPPGTVTVGEYETIMVAPRAPKSDKEHR